MAPTANSSRKSGVSAVRNARNASIKQGNTLGVDDMDPILQPSQSSSDDGMMATIAQQMQVSMEKKKREKEGKFLQVAQAELSRILSGRAQDLADGVTEIDNIYTDFQEAYAINEDHIRKLWDAIMKEQLTLQTLIEEKQKSSLDREKRREKENIQAIAHCRKACEEFQRLIDSLEPGYDRA